MGKDTFAELPVKCECVTLLSSCLQRGAVSVCAHCAKGPGKRGFDEVQIHVL